MAKEFPACNWLGYGLDMTTLTPIDVKSVMEATKKARRVIKYDLDKDTYIVPIGGVEYNVPNCIGVSDYNISDGNYTTYSTGTEASSTFQADASLSVRYMAVSASASASYALEKSFKRDDQFAFYSFNADTYLASLRDYADLLNETALTKRLDNMPKFDGGDDHSLAEWKDFFASFGSHIILNASYGARFQLNVWASNQTESVNKSFSASVNAAFEGVAFGGKFDASVKSQEQYKTFSEYMQKTVSVIGGDPELNKVLTADPTKYDVFVKWAATVAKESSLGSFNVVEIWNLMRDASTKDLRDRSDMVKEAYDYIVSHPQPYQTAISLDIQSDWAEFNLLSPSATIIADTKNPWPANNTVASGTRVQWGKEYSHDYQKQTLRFFVINDGSPIDFSISHGSNGATPGAGLAEVLMEREHYPSKGVTDNVWNTSWFYQKPVSPKPVQKAIN
ncbi:hypothetical protein K503DRAFT_772164 [Rhizopogon vinicolor AM-OR11-026]|uniref:MACPF domain-containing protein n=1 Tax=Rhizopogon vinicolor AM-OR11-026 TaxID=1314800 RepID=A0A1B7MW48_9AGAM|nr:hypothetical protein K503DRAFT_772164 [Rhizopogon vinicolor AM-OR11-026]